MVRKTAESGHMPASARELYVILLLTYSQVFSIIVLYIAMPESTVFNNCHIIGFYGATPLRYIISALIGYKDGTDAAVSTKHLLNTAEAVRSAKSYKTILHTDLSRQFTNTEILKERSNSERQ